MVPLHTYRMYATISAMLAGATADVVDAAQWVVPVDSVLVGVCFDSGVPTKSLIAAEVSRQDKARDALASIYGLTFAMTTDALPAGHERKRWNSVQGMSGVSFPSGSGIVLAVGERVFLNYDARNYGGNWAEDGYVTAYLYSVRKADYVREEKRQGPIVLGDDSRVGADLGRWYRGLRWRGLG